MSHLCPKCKKEWFCLTEANFGDCDNGEEDYCYECAGMPNMKKLVTQKMKV